MESGEREQVLRAMGGDPAAYGMLIDAYQGMVFGLALNITGDYQDSEDIVQEAFLRAWQKLRTLSDPARFAAWLYTLARRLALDHLRRRQRVPLVTGEAELIDLVHSDAETPAEAFARKQLSELLWREVADLPSKAREAILLFYMEGFSIRRAAAFLDTSEEAVKARLAYGRERLREGLAGKLQNELGRRHAGSRMRGAILAALPGAGWKLTGGTSLSSGGGEISRLGCWAASVKTPVMVIGAIVLLTLSAMLVSGGFRLGPGPSPHPGPAPLADQRNEGRHHPDENAGRIKRAGETDPTSSTASAAAAGADGASSQTGRMMHAALDAATTSTARATGWFAGRVIDEQGRPIAGATVYNLPEGMAGMLRSLDQMTTYALCQTGKDGLFKTNPLKPARYILTAGAAGYALPILNEDVQKIPLQPGQERTGVEFRLRKGYSISGHVFDVAHAPLAGAAVKIQSVKTDIVNPVMLNNVVTTGKDGAYRLEALMDGSYFLSATKENYAEDTKQEIRAGASGVDFVLGQEAGIRGRVTIKKTGQPVAGVVVKAQGGTMSSGGAFNRAVVSLKDGKATTDKDGRYEIKGLSVAKYPVIVDPYGDGGKVLTAPERFELTVPGKVIDHVDFAMARSSMLSGKVTDAKTGKPIAGAKVYSKRYALNKFTTGADGLYRLPDLRSERHFLRAEAEGYTLKENPGFDREGACCEVNVHRQIDVAPEEDQKGIDFAMTPEAVIEGRVVDEDGVPLHDVSIQLLAGAGLNYNYNWKIVTDRGFYKIRGVMPGDYCVKASRKDYVSERSDSLHVEEGAKIKPPDIVLYREGATVSGRITQADGPIEGAEIRAVQVYGKMKRAIADFHTCSQGRSDAAGHYELRGVSAGLVELQVLAAGFKMVTRQIEIRDPKEKTTEDFQLGATGPIRGTVRDSQGQPLAGVMIVGEPDSSKPSLDTDPSAGSTGADGRFSFELNPELTYNLKLSLAGYQILQQNGVRAGQKDLELTMQPCGGMKFTLVDAAAGTPITACALMAYDESQIKGLKQELWDNLSRAARSESGEYTVDSLQAGVYTLVIIADDHKKFERTGIHVVPEKTADAGRIGLSK